MLIQQAKIWPQPTVAIAAGGLALLALTGALFAEGLQSLDPGRTALILILALAIVAAYQFPIHLRRSQKIEMTTVALYLITVLTPSIALGALAAGLGLLGAELIVRAKRGNYYSDVATAVGRYTIIVLVGACIPRLLAAESLVSYIVTALVLLTLDFLSVPILVAPASGDKLLSVLVESVKRGLPLEAAQYLVGLIGVFAIHLHVWNLALLLLPIAAMQVGFKHLMERSGGATQAPATVLQAHPDAATPAATAAVQDKLNAGLAAPWSEVTIISELQQGSSTALQQAIANYGPQLYRFAMYELDDAVLAEDLVAAVFARTLQTAERATNPGVSLQIWLFRLALDIMRDYESKHALTVPDRLLTAASAALPPDLTNSLRQLTSKQRQVLLLRLVEGWDSAQIAALLDCPVDSITSSQYLGLRSMIGLLD